MLKSLKLATSFKFNKFIIYKQILAFTQVRSPLLLGSRLIYSPIVTKMF